MQQSPRCNHTTMPISSHPDLLKGIYAMGFNKPSKIQERALPLLLSNPWVACRSNRCLHQYESFLS